MGSGFFLGHPTLSGQFVSTIPPTLSILQSNLLAEMKIDSSLSMNLSVTPNALPVHVGDGDGVVEIRFNYKMVKRINTIHIQSITREMMEQI